MKLLILTLVHDFSGDGWNDAYLCDRSDPNHIVRGNMGNIQQFTPKDTSVIIHVNKAFTTFDENIQTEYPGVYVNPTRFSVLHPMVQGSKVAHCALASYLTSYAYAKQLGLDFDYVTIVHSSEMFVKHGIMDYISQHEFSSWFPPKSEKNLQATHVYQYTKNLHSVHGKDLFCGLFDPNDDSQYGLGQVEGSFYTKALFDKMYQWFNTNYNIASLNKWPMYLEEIMIPTLAYHLSETKQPATGTNAFFVLQGHKPLADMAPVEAVRQNHPVPIWGANQYALAAAEGRWVASDSTNLFTVKRVNRTSSDPVRQAILQLT